MSSPMPSKRPGVRRRHVLARLGHADVVEGVIREHRSAVALGASGVADEQARAANGGRRHRLLVSRHEPIERRRVEVVADQLPLVSGDRLAEVGVDAVHDRPVVVGQETVVVVVERLGRVARRAPRVGSGSPGIPSAGRLAIRSGSEPAPNTVLEFVAVVVVEDVHHLEPAAVALGGALGRRSAWLQSESARPSQNCHSGE